MRTTHVIVEGLVQRVCFRDATRRQAESLHISGWVRNLPNGSVEVVLCGPPENIDKMVCWLRQGPPRARVDNLQITELSDDDHQFSLFEIRF